MNSKKTALSFAAVGTAAGVAGLVLLASPAGAGEAPPALPAIGAEQLVESVLSTDVPALGGSVELQNNLGLPIPGLPGGMGGGGDIHVYTDGHGRGRISVPTRGSETTVVDDGSTVWVWDSADKSVVKVPHGAEKGKTPLESRFADPATAARDLVNAMQEDSTVDVDGTARVAGRPVYQLVLAPKPTERTLLREVRIAVDAQERMPLRLTVLGQGSTSPALQIGFTDLTFGPQDPARFTFTPPAGAKVTDAPNRNAARNDKPNVVGDGWDRVVVEKVPADRTKDLAGLGSPVSGSWGSGRLIKTAVATAIVTDDGRVAAGAVPEQVLSETLSK
jgi:outer membrane lipoprotein-sorting protein